MNATTETSPSVQDATRSDPIPCVGCGAFLSPNLGPTHAYMQSSPGCWATFGQILEREYSDPAWFTTHRLTVDSYAVQHPGRPSPQSVQSVALHLISLYLILETDLEPRQATVAMQSAARDKSRFIWLEPPASRGSISVAAVVGAHSASEHVAIVRAWAASTWAAWASHHPTIRTWAQPTRRTTRD